MTVHKTAMAEVERDLPIGVRAAIDLAVIESGGHRGPVRVTAIGQERLVREFLRYGSIVDDGPVLVALGADAECLRATIAETSTPVVITVVDGLLARPLRGVRANGAALGPDLSCAAWHSVGYERVAAHGIQGIGSLAWAVLERGARGIRRPELADRCRIGMLRTLRTAPVDWPLAMYAVHVYRRRS